MDVNSLYKGLPYIIIPTLVAPIHLRILCVLLRYEEYRKMQCYKIMTHIEVFDCLIIPYYICQGLSTILKSQLTGLTVFFGSINASLLTCIVCMDMVLALNRLKVLCDVKYPTAIDKITIWLSGAVSFGITLLPFAGFKLSEDEFELRADLNRPWTKYNGIYLSFVPIFCSLITFFIYLFVCAVLAYKRIRIFLKKSYRSQECYCIMIHIGVAQCLFAPGMIINTTRVLTGANFWILPEITTKLFPSENRMEALMSVALAMNRLKVMCGLRYPSAIHTAIVAFAWVFGVVNYGLLFSPWYNFYMSDQDYLSHYDMSKPLTPTMKTMGSVVIICCSIIQLVLYTIIVAYIIRMQGKLSKKLQSRKEMNILLYACARFLFDVVAVCAVYGYFPIPDTEFGHISSFQRSLLHKSNRGL
ncbi:hypothetical protein QR680_010002 [Steinernema hermaphroditum]|uniref:Uncharacterized protein n=1 Tax=Steinernema hermaphroditum TaxID=289476 RepID=A0AA39INR2_9BILA|nr:hypothetical protein QR680_010002 [Steinernema hermaphroditum]